MMFSEDILKCYGIIINRSDYVRELNQQLTKLIKNTIMIAYLDTEA